MEVIAIFHQNVDIKTGHSIHSSGQLEYFKNHVFADQSIKVDSLQCIITPPNSHAIPLDIKNGLPAHMKIRPYTDSKEWDLLPHVIMTGDTLLGNPKCSDAEISVLGSGWENFVYDHLHHLTDSALDSYSPHYKHQAINPSDIMVAMAIKANTCISTTVAPVSAGALFSSTMLVDEQRRTSDDKGNVLSIVMIARMMIKFFYSFQRTAGNHKMEREGNNPLSMALALP